jgi:hypothetical protein
MTSPTIPTGPNVVPIDRSSDARPADTVVAKDLVPSGPAGAVATRGSDSRSRLALVTAAGRSAGRALSRVSSPPELWQYRQPSLRDIASYAWYGQQTGVRTLGRFASKTYAVLVALPITALMYLALWVIERPSRLAVIAALLWLLSLIF